LSRRLDPEAKILASNINQVTVVLGDEFDDMLRSKLLKVLRQLDATSSGPASKSLAGSQELEELTLFIDGRMLRVEAETYVGLSITGPADLVHRIQSLLTMSS
jgi:hypothetical protein